MYFVLFEQGWRRGAGASRVQNHAHTKHVVKHEASNFLNVTQRTERLAGVGYRELDGDHSGEGCTVCGFEPLHHDTHDPIHLYVSYPRRSGHTFGTISTDH